MPADRPAKRAAKAASTRASSRAAPAKKAAKTASKAAKPAKRASPTKPASPRKGSPGAAKPAAAIKGKRATRTPTSPPEDPAAEAWEEVAASPSPPAPQGSPFHALQPPAPAAPAERAPGAPAPALAWEPVPPQPPPFGAVPGRVFDPATGAWVTPAEQQAATDPAARRRGGVPTFFHVVLAIDLALAALSLVLSAAAGAVLIFAPGSDVAADLRESMGVGSPAELWRLTFLSFLMFGIVPVAWLLGTRVKAVEGTLRYLQLRFAPKDWVRGILVGIGLVAAVLAVSAAYVCATDGCDALDEDPAASDDEAPAIQDMVANLNWPLALFIALAAGIGEEIFFRGLLQKHLGWWGQAILFGLFHVGNGYVPQIVVATAIGFLFGWLQRRGWSMWSLMLAHALYDFILLAAALVAES